MLLGALFLALLAGALLCLYRLAAGPGAPDRAAAAWTLGTLSLGFCVLAAVETGRGFYLDVALTWAVLCLVAALALAKYLEGRPLDD